MTRDFSNHPARHLTAHFFLGLFDFGILSEAGADAFQRGIIGLVAIMLTTGLLLTRVYLDKYVDLSAMFTRRGPYLIAVLGDDTLAIALPMLVVAFTTLLVSHSLFPDEIDFRVLLPLPIPKRTVFLSKLASLLMFECVFIVAAHIAVLPLVVLTSASRWSEHTMVARILAFEVSSLLASFSIVAGVIAVNGAILLLVPRVYLRTVAVVVRSVLISSLVLSLPLVAKLPAIGPFVVDGAEFPKAVPPVWFLGLEQVVLGANTATFRYLGHIAIIAVAASSILAVISYTHLYRHFDMVMLSRSQPMNGSRRWLDGALERVNGSSSGALAVTRFAWATLCRSPLHQSVFAIVSACGGALVIGSFTMRPSTPDATIRAALWSPFALVFALNLACRAAFVLPLELRANWIFRLTETDAARQESLSAVVGAVVVMGVVVPLLILLPMELVVLGASAIRALSIALLCGLALVETHMSEWRQLPFTCLYVPGKRFVGHTLLLVAAAFVAFTTIGSWLASSSRSNTTAWLASLAGLGVIVWLLRRHRLWFASQTDLVFEELLPTEVEPLQLSAY